MKNVPEAERPTFSTHFENLYRAAQDLNDQTLLMYCAISKDKQITRSVIQIVSLLKCFKNTGDVVNDLSID